jgi:HSP20 family protein
MANTPVEVKETAPAVANAPDTWRSFRTEMDRLFDRFAGGWGMPALRRMFDAEPAFQYESSFAIPSPAVDRARRRRVEARRRRPSQAKEARYALS